MPADGLLSLGLPMPTLKVSLLLSKSVVSAPGQAPTPVKSLAVESAPQSPRGSSPVGSEWDAASFHSAGVSPATSASLSITHRTADLQILTPPPAHQPLVIQLNTDPSLLAQLATARRDWLPQILRPSFSIP